MVFDGLAKTEPEMLAVASLNVNPQSFSLLWLEELNGTVILICSGEWGGGGRGSGGINEVQNKL